LAILSLQQPMEASMPAGDLNPFFRILSCHSAFSLCFDPKKFEGMEVHIHDKMPCCDNGPFNKFDKIS
jgi:hypothetical protein